MKNSLFRDPNSGQELSWSDDQKSLLTSAGEVAYELVDGCFRLLPNGPEDGTFAYREHYQADAEVFDYFAGWEDPAAVHENQRLHEMILKQAPKNLRTVLDVGCGSAWVAAHFAHKGVEVYSMDISTVNPERALADYAFDGHVGVIADVFALPFQEKSFDLIIASEIIEHVPDPGAFLQQLLPALAPGGVLVVTTPHDEKLAHSLCIHCNKPTPHHGHLHSFTAETIRALLPSSLRAGAKTVTFVNKLLLHARSHILLRHFPFWLWRLVDGLTSVFLPKTARLMMVVERGAS